MKPRRYWHVSDEVQKLRAEHVVEIGTWNGDRAIEIVRSVGGRWPLTYYGFDMFEEMTKETAEKEKHVKKWTTYNEVLDKLGKESYRKVSEDSYLPSFVLIKGDTRKTLPKFVTEDTMYKMDLIWIDGGHSIETVMNDWSCSLLLVRKGGVILLDDYYTGSSADPNFGCNTIVDSVLAAWSDSFNVEFFTEVDPVAGGGGVQIVKVTRRQ